MEKQKLLFHQARLANRGVAEMVLLHISACKGVPSEMVMKTLQLGISILRGGNIDIQMVSFFSEFQMKLKHNFKKLSGNVKPLKREKRCRLLHVNRRTYELLQRLRFRRF